MHGTLTPPLSIRERKVLQALTDAANFSRPCPTNKRLAELLGVRSVSTPAEIIRTLEKRGYITVDRFQMARNVRINASGAKTRLTDQNTPHWRQQTQTKDQLNDHQS